MTRWVCARICCVACTSTVRARGRTYACLPSCACVLIARARRRRARAPAPRAGFERPSAIQQRAIVPMVKGRDLIAQSQSGTGKTAVFSIGILQMLDLSSTETQALVLSPTRELAEQSQKVMMALGSFMSVRCHACIGGKSVGEDIRRLEGGVHAVSGTPGRVFDMIRRRHLRTRNIKLFVLDEADEMLNRGFKEQIYDIYRYLPPSTQVVLVSATMPQEVLDMTNKFMNKPVRNSCCYCGGGSSSSRVRARRCSWGGGGGCVCVWARVCRVRNRPPPARALICVTPPARGAPTCSCACS